MSVETGHQVPCRIPGIRKSAIQESGNVFLFAKKKHHPWRMGIPKMDEDDDGDDEDKDDDDDDDDDDPQSIYLCTVYIYIIHLGKLY